MINQDETVTKQMRKLQKEGFSSPYGIREGNLVDLMSGDIYEPEMFRVVENYEFVADDDPEEKSTLYALEHTEKEERGLLLEAHRAKTLPGTEKVVDILVSQIA